MLCFKLLIENGHARPGRRSPIKRHRNNKAVAGIIAIAGSERSLGGAQNLVWKFAYI
jgi:hypothetical protein